MLSPTQENQYKHWNKNVDIALKNCSEWVAKISRYLKSETSPPFLYKIADQEGFERVMAEIKLVSMQFYIQIIKKNKKSA